jgi:hypothetical protein
MLYCAAALLEAERATAQQQSHTPTAGKVDGLVCSQASAAASNSPFIRCHDELANVAVGDTLGPAVLVQQLLALHT